jgi:hypothetical protein
MTSRLKPGFILAALSLAVAALAYPPAPHHTIYGMVRNQWGNPINLYPSDVFLETPSGTTLRSSLVNGLEPGANYRLHVPMDSGTAPDLYQPTALRPFFQFKLKIQIGQTSYLPLEMAGNFSQFGHPGQSTHLDLTLGVDSDGDGLPDAWEEELIAILGGTLADIHPDGDSDGDGISNRDEYLAGTYAFDPEDGFRLAITHVNAGVATVEFLAIHGRNYTLESTADLIQWRPVNFRVVTGSVTGNPQSSYQATDVRLLRVEVPVQNGVEETLFFRALVR